MWVSALGLGGSDVDEYGVEVVVEVDVGERVFA